MSNVTEEKLQIIQRGIEKEMPKQHISKVPEINRIPNIPFATSNVQMGGKLPKNWGQATALQNEKFLNNYQGLIEDYMPEKQLEQFVDYQNFNFAHGMYGDSKQDQENEAFLSDNRKESLFNSCHCKTRRQLEKVVRESMIGVDNFGVFPNSWTSLLPQFTNFSYQTLVTFGNATLNRGCTYGAETGGYNTTTAEAIGNNEGQAAKYTDSAGMCYDQLAMYWKAGGGEKIAFYDNTNTRVGAGQSRSAGTNQLCWNTSEVELETTAAYVCLAFVKGGQNSQYGKASGASNGQDDRHWGGNLPATGGCPGAAVIAKTPGWKYRSQYA